MFSVSNNGPDRLDINISGKLTQADMSTALEQLLAAANDIEHGRMLYEISDFAFPTLGAIAVELSHLPALFGLMRKFEHVAVVAEAQWIRRVGEWEGALLPGVEIRGFETVAEAEAWLAASARGG